jgi:ParB family chromosome partitioning protein
VNDFFRLVGVVQCRCADESKVRELADSIREIGLLNPVSVTPDKRLIAGAHRLEAVKLLGETTINANIVEGDDLHWELAEIDENLVRNELDSIAIGELAIRRDEILEALGMRATVGQGRPAKNGDNLTPLKTTTAIAKEIGVGERTLQRYKQLARNLVPEAKEAVRNAEIPKNDALKLARMPAEKQIEIAGQIRDGKAKSVKEAELIEAKQKVKRQSQESVQQSPPTVFLGDGIQWLEEQGHYDLLLTDPPYMTDVPNIETFAQRWLPIALGKLKPTGSAYVFIGAYPQELKAYLNVPMPNGIELVQVLVWTYKNTLGNNPKDRYKQNWQAVLYFRGKDTPPLDCPLTAEQWSVIETNAPDGRLGNRFHAWQKPDGIAERFIRHSTKTGDTVFDPFCCTGTFLLAAARLGRIGKGAENNSDNSTIAIERGCIYAA